MTVPGNGAPVILLLFTAGPIDVSWAESNANVKAIFQCSFPGQAAGEAIRKILTADSHASPAGRLPYTWYKTLNQVNQSNVVVDNETSIVEP